ncbi:MAG: hypothetical protein FWD93_00340 [Coriobacteriia bacterium]|nr:hypothetical protein [Coriobacteriia bacterium]MCL2750176.1 hypothetical protein [Coriobacteriia bacterium]
MTNRAGNNCSAEEGGSGGFWSAQRYEILSGLAEIHPVLADLYKNTIDQLSIPPTKVSRVVRFMLICHCMRELINVLPDVLKDVTDFSIGGRVDESEARKRLLAAYQKLSLAKQQEPPELLSASIDSQASGATREVSDELLLALEEWAGIQQAISLNESTRDSAAALGRINVNDPSLRAWKNSAKFFRYRGHLDRGKMSTIGSEISVPSDEDIINNLEVIESYLDYRIKGFFKVLEEISELVEKANKKDVAVPADILIRLSNNQVRRVFYSKLENPNWVAQLNNFRAFDNPPDIEVDSEGNHYYPFWPELEYLVKMSSAASSEVADVLLVLPDSTNPHIIRSIIDAASAMEPVDMSRIAEKVYRWPDDYGFRYVDGDSVIRLLEGLFDNGFFKEGRRLANYFLEPMPGVGEPAFGTSEPRSRIEDYRYRDVIEVVAPRLGAAAVPAISNWLAVYQQHSGAYPEESGRDYSVYWRPSIQHEEGRVAHEIGDSLVESLDRCLREELLGRQDHLKSCISCNQPLIRRVAIHSLTAALSNFEDGDCKREDLIMEQPNIVAVANELLSNGEFLDRIYSSEFLLFIQQCGQFKDVFDFSALLCEIRKGPPYYRDLLIDEGNSVYIKRWQHRYLTAVGSANLPEDLDVQLALLDGELGTLDIEDLGESAYIIKDSFGSQNPISIEEMRSMTFDELLEHLKSWHPEDGIWGSSHRGQGYVLAQLVAEKPGVFIARHKDLQMLRPTYLRAVIDGIAAGINSGLSVDWDTVLKLCEWVIGLGHNAYEDYEGSESDDDRSYSDTLYSVLRLVELGLKVNEEEGFSENCLQGLVTTLCVLMEDLDPEEENLDAYGGSWSPLMLSLNAIRPKAIRYAIRVLYRFQNHSETDKLLGALDNHLPDKDNFLSIAASCGEGLAKLYDVRPDWVIKRLDRLIGTNESFTPAQQVLFSTALAIQRPHHFLLSVYKQRMLEIVLAGSDVDYLVGWNQDKGKTLLQYIGEWIIWLLFWGKISREDELVEAWFNQAKVEVRARVMAEFSHAFAFNNGFDEQHLEAARKIWDWRFKQAESDPGDELELEGFYWLVSSGRFEWNWWLPKLAYLTSLIPEIELTPNIGDKLAEASSFDALTAFQVIKNLFPVLKAKQHYRYYDVINNAVPVVLAKALTSGNDDLVKQSTSLLDEFGRIGFIEMKDQVDSIIRGYQPPNEG